MPAPLKLPLTLNSLVTSSLISKFSPAYILVVPTSSTYNTHQTISFVLDGATDAQVITGRDLSTAPTCWSHLIEAEYQPSAATDGDPNTELKTFGKTPRAYQISHIYLETIRDNFDPDLRNPAKATDALNALPEDIDIVVAHEIGQAPGDGIGGTPYIGEGGLMAEGDFSKNQFSPATIRRFRRSQTFDAD